MKGGAKVVIEAHRHEGVFIAHERGMDRIDLHKHTGGSSVIVYGQTELTRDLYDARAKMKGNVIHNVEDVKLCDLTAASP